MDHISFKALTSSQRQLLLALRLTGNFGLTFHSVESDGAGTYNGGQVYFTAVGTTAGSYCLTATGEFTGSVTYDVSGGTGKFAHASGSLTITFKGQTLAAPGSPSGKPRSFRRS